MRFFSLYLTPHAVPLKPIVPTLGLHYQCLQLKFDTLYFRRVYSLNWMECSIVSLCGHEFETHLCFLFSRLIFWYFSSLYDFGKTFHIVYFFPPKDMNGVIILSVQYLLSLSAATPTHMCEGHPAVRVYALSDPMGICIWYCHIIQRSFV